MTATAPISSFNFTLQSFSWLPCILVVSLSSHHLCCLLSSSRFAKMLKNNATTFSCVRINFFFQGNFSFSSNRLTKRGVNDKNADGAFRLLNLSVSLLLISNSRTVLKESNQNRGLRLTQSQLLSIIQLCFPACLIDLTNLSCNTYTLFISLSSTHIRLH